jgi:hemoglobin
MDLESRADIDRLMVRFYGRALADPLIGHFFTDVVKLDLEHHLPVIGDFWESTLFGTGSYRRHGRNPLLVHEELDRKSRLEPEHFHRWLELFAETVDESFAGPRAEFAKQRAHAIARRMLEHLGHN